MNERGDDKGDRVRELTEIGRGGGIVDSIAATTRREAEERGGMVPRTIIRDDDDEMVKMIKVDKGEFDGLRPDLD